MTGCARGLLVAAVLLAPAGSAYAFESYAANVPCRATATNTVGTVRPCITCHNNPDGGAGCTEGDRCLNPFGMAFYANGTRWSAALATMDSDGDGYTNGEELGDPSGTWTASAGTPSTCDCATRPGFASFTPADADGDRDAYCCRGRDLNSDRDCLDASEHEGSADCDDGDATSRPGQPEMCSNPADNDCDGLITVLDPECASVVDRDGDGFCPMGRDDNDDQDCIDSGEMTAESDCEDDEATVYPTAFENCLDGVDNNCDDVIDRADPMCNGDADADGDGFCPIGRDLTGDGDCLDTDEEDAGFDCNDRDVLVNTAQTEACTDGADNDCDGRADFRDESCRDYFDFDSDGYCAIGRDGDGDGDCVDPAEIAMPGDCDDEEPAINPGRMEVCTNSVDDDCDTRVSLADSDCGGYLDGDGDRYCFIGYDINDDGDCAEDGEAMGVGDCDDASAAINPTIPESCTNGVDDDCDGSTDAFDRPTCDEYRDRDGDGWCAIGRDMDDDGGCSDPGEEQEPNDRDWDDYPTVYPGAPENCFDRLDNDLDATVDEAAACTSDEDTDGDGYCPVGRDANGDGDCVDDDENVAVSDCAPDDADIHPDAMESCRQRVDHDCDGDTGLLDDDCFALLDRDHDGFCGIGIDDNNNGSCVDDGEDRFGADCDDTQANVNPRAIEICDDGIDDDCNMLVDEEDPSCPCVSDERCEDDDPCTIDACREGVCSNDVAPTCVDAGERDAGMEPPPPSGCACSSAGSRGANLSWMLLAILGLVLWRRRPRAAWAAALLVTFAAAPVAYAFPPFRDRVPQGRVFGTGASGDGCLLCHSHQDGGAGCVAGGGARPCLNSFGLDFRSTTGGRSPSTWDAWLRDRDSDGDLRTNGLELVYLASSFPSAAVGDPTLASQPGAATSVHTDECALQASSFGVTGAPLNYTNCASDEGVACTNGSSSAGAPLGSRYFGFDCSCMTGYAGNGRRDVPGDGVADGAANGCVPIDPCLAAGTCVDPNECVPAGICGTNGTACTNLRGSYQCGCAAGFAAPSMGGACADIDECALDNPCAPGTCVNDEGAYSCSACPTGFRLSGGRCVDVDECAGSPCSGGLCLQNTPGHYSCIRCPIGYAAPAQDGTCTDIDECGIAGSCDEHAACTNTTGSFLCECDAGYEGPGEECSDIDECLLSMCDDNSTCTNTAGSFFCTCNDGFRRVGLACEDIDECSDGSAFCRRDEVCHNRTGMRYECVCAPGFERPSPTAQCQPTCGDGVRGVGEGCDDGNNADGDGCADCQVERGFVCYEAVGAGSSCEATCGDGVIQPEAREECDEADANNDTSPDACRTDCRRAYCGDTVLDEGETCDDGADNSDEAPNACRTSCAPAFCGDDVIDDGETCDPGGDAALPMESCTTGCEMPMPDAGSVSDAGTEPPVEDGGCGVSHARSTPSYTPVVAFFAVLGILIRRRRRSVRS